MLHKFVKKYFLNFYYEKKKNYFNYFLIIFFFFFFKAVKEGKVLLEWDGSGGEKAPCPLLKDVFATERKRAKTLNFSIAYGKTAIGLAKDWGVSLDEAKATLDLRYAD